MKKKIIIISILIILILTIMYGVMVLNSRHGEKKICSEHIDVNIDMICDNCSESLPIENYLETKTATALSESNTSVNITGSMPKDTVADITNIPKEDAIETAKNYMNIAEENIIQAYDISLNSDLIKYQPSDYNKTVKVELSNLELEEDKKYAMLHIIDDKKYEIIPVEKLSNNKISFNATSFSTYILITVEGHTITFNGENYKVYDMESNEITDGTIIASGTNFMFYVRPNDGWGLTDITCINAAATSVAIETSGYIEMKNVKIASVAEDITIDVATVIAPSITVQPVTVKAKIGNTVNFTIKAENATNYQWQYRDSKEEYWTNANKTNSTSGTATLSVTAAFGISGREYRCLVGNANYIDHGRIKSDLFRIVVAEDEITEPVTVWDLDITKQPESQKIKFGETATFKVETAGNNTFKWQYKTSNESGDWLDVDANLGTSSAVASGFATNTLKIDTSKMTLNSDTLEVANNLSNYVFRCVVNSTIYAPATKTSDSAFLSVAQDEYAIENIKTKTPATLTVSANATVGVGKTTEVTFEYNGDGILSASSNDENIVTATVSGDKLILTGVAEGTAIVTLSATAGQTYGSASATLEVEVIDENKFLITEWTIPADADGTLTSEGVAKTTITLPIPTATTNAYTVDWGDGTTNTYDSTADFPTHTYTNTAEAVYIISIKGKVYRFGYYESGNGNVSQDDKNYTFTQYLTGLKQWGELEARRYGFAKCRNLTGTIPNLSVNSFTYVNNVSNLFAYCSGLTGGIPENLFDDLTNVQDFLNVFTDCKNLTGSIPANLFANTTNVTDIHAIFAGCSGLEGEIPAGLFKNTRLITNITAIFSGCSGLTGSIPLNLFENMPLIEKSSLIFTNCSGLTGSIPSELFLSMSQTTTFREAFNGCTGLKGEIPATLFMNNKQVKDFGRTFEKCSGLTGSIPESLFADIITVENFQYTFSECSGLTGSIPEGLFASAENVTIYQGTFNKCSELTGSIPAKLFEKASLVKNYQSVFSECYKLSGEIPAGLFANSPLAEDFSNAFKQCLGLTGSVPADLFANNPAAKSFTWTFWNCNGLTSVPAGLFRNNPNSTANLSQTFAYCKNLTSAVVDVPSVGYRMFGDCNQLIDITITDDVQKIGTDSFMATSPYNSNNLLATNLTTSNPVALAYDWNSDNRSLETDGPVVAFTPNGNTTYATSQSATVTVVDEGLGLDENSLMYQWTQSTITPTEDSFTTNGTSFANGNTITKDTGSGNNWYLWIIAKDVVGNTVITSSNAFYLDNESPTVTLDSRSKVFGDSINITLKDDHSGVTGWQVTETNVAPTTWNEITSTTNTTVSYTPSKATKYYAWAKDSLGNVSTSVEFTIEKRDITITAGSATKNYDGSELVLSSNDYEITGTGLGNGHTIEVELLGSQTEIGTSASTIGTVVIKDANSVDVTESYDITKIAGTLEVSEKIEPILMSETLTNAYNNNYILGYVSEDIKRKDVATIFIKDNQDTPAGEIVHTWDVSKKKDGSVTAWLVKNIANTSRYDLHIGGDGKIVVLDGNLLFSCYTNCTKIEGLEYLDMSEATSMAFMFGYSSSLTSININSFNTSKVTDMAAMFLNCTKLKDVYVNEIDTSSVKVMACMFSSCSSLTNLDISNFDTSSLDNKTAAAIIKWGDTEEECIDIEGMFQKCTNLKTITLGENFGVNSSSMFKLFYNCTSLENIDTSKINTSNVKNMASVFEACSSLSNIDLTIWDTSNVTNMTSMFAGCSSLIDLELFNFNTINVTAMDNMFNGCSNLKTIILGVDFDKINGTSMFESTDNLSAIISQKSIVSSDDVMTLNTQIANNSNTTLYVPNTTSESVYEEDSNYLDVFGADNIKPILELSGDSIVTVFLDNTYTDAGATVADYGIEDRDEYTKYGYTLSDAEIKDLNGNTVNSVETSNEAEYTVTYTLSYSRETASGNTITIPSVTTTRTVKVVAGDITGSEFIITIPYEEVEYDGQAKTPTVTIVKDGTTLNEGDDFTVSYTNNIDAANKDDAEAPTVTVTGIGEYYGTKDLTFTIEPAELAVDWNNNSLVYNGKPQAPTAGTDNKLTGFNGDIIIISVEGAETDSGSNYLATATITGAEVGKPTNYVLTNTTKLYSIGKASPTITVDNADVFVEKDKSVTVKYTYTGDGEVKVSSNDEDVAIATIDTINKQITITGVSENTTTVTVTLKEGTNYLETSKTINVFVEDTAGMFVTEWQIPVDADGVGNGTTVVLPIPGYIGNSFEVRWGDGTRNNYTVDTFPTHTYENTEEKTVTIQIRGKVNTFGYSRTYEPTETNTYSKYYTFTKYLRKIVAWGDLEATSLGFANCTELAGTIPAATGFANLTSVENMFYNCISLTGSIPTGFLAGTSNIANAKGMFMNCIGLEGTISADFFNANTAIKSFESTFAGCSNLTGTIPVGLFDNMTEVTSYACTFSGCSGLAGEIPAELFADSTKVKSFSQTFADCSRLVSAAADANGVVYAVPSTLFANQANVNNYYRTFYNCIGLTGIVDTGLFESNKIIVAFPKDESANGNFKGTFEGCTGITEANLSTKIIGHEMFKGCTSLEEVKLSQAIDIGNRAFYECNKLSYIDINKDYLLTVGSDAFEYTGTNPAKLFTQVNRDNEVLVAYDWSGDNRTLDIEAPIGRVEIVTDKYPFTNTQDIALKISLTDDNSDATDCEIAILNEDVYASLQDGSLAIDNLPWQAYIENTEWTLTSGDGIKTVYVLFKDEIGNISSVRKNIAG